MKVTQVATLVNSAVQGVLGADEVVLVDLSNVVSIGKALENADKLDAYVKKLVNHIGKVIFVERLYAGGVPSVLMDSWEYGSILEKISTELPNAEESDSWKLTGGAAYPHDKFYQPKVNVKFFNQMVTFDIPLSFTEKQIKQSFSNANQLNGFLSMLTTSVENAMTVKLDALIMRTIVNMVGETLSDGLTVEEVFTPTGTRVKAVNLLYLFNAEYTETLTVDKCLTNPEFIRFATYQIGLYTDRMARISKLFNVGGSERFTPKDKQHTVLLSDFAKASESFLLSNTFNQDKVMLPSHETVPYWQGSGLNYAFADVSKVNAKLSSGVTVEMGGILGVIFDRDALGVSNLDKRVTTSYNPKAEFYTNFYKFDAGFYNDLDENFVVFFVG